MIRELPDIRSRRAAAALAVAWGYPRPITELELQTGFWFSTPDGIAWLIWGVREGELHMHGARRPEARPSVISRELTKQVLAAAKEIGAKRVTQPLGPPDAGIKRLWVRAGWTLDEYGMPFMEVW